MSDAPNRNICRVTFEGFIDTDWDELVLVKPFVSGGWSAYELPYLVEETCIDINMKGGDYVKDSFTDIDDIDDLQHAFNTLQILGNTPYRRYFKVVADVLVDPSGNFPEDEIYSIVESTETNT